MRLWQLRDFAEGNYRRVDDRPFGGGPGMVMQADPLYRCWQAIRADHRTDADGAEPVPTVLFSPLGERAGAPGGRALLHGCGRHPGLRPLRGLDQRFIDACVDVQLAWATSCSGGEIPAMALPDSVARLQPGVLNDEGSYQQDSFNPALDGLLDCPHYTRPEVWQGPRARCRCRPCCCRATMARSGGLAAPAAPAPDRPVGPDVLASVCGERGALSCADLHWLREQGLDKT